MMSKDQLATYRVGTGGFGDIYCVKLLPTHEPVAIKVLNFKSQNSSAATKESLLREARLMMHLQSKRVVVC